MNILKYELKSQAVSTVVWTVAIGLVFWGLMVGIYPLFQDSVADTEKIFESFPPQFAAVFGLEIKTIFSFSGYYGFCFGYLGLMGAIMASALGISVFARERRSRCSDFLLTRPLSRTGIFMWKLSACLILLAAVNIVYMILAVTAGEQNDTDMTLAGSSMLFTQLVFFALGTFYGGYAKRIRSAAGAATAIGFGAFIVSALTGLLDEEWMRFISPLKYFDPADALNSGSYEFKYAVTGAAVILICMGAAYRRFVKNDMKAI